MRHESAHQSGRTRREVRFVRSASRDLPAELSSAFVHELRQPLTTILLNAQAAVGMLEANGEAPDVPELRTILGEIIRADQRATVVMARLHALIRHDPLIIDPLNPADLVDEALEITRAEARLHQIDTRVAVEADAPEVLGDRVQLQQVLVNLITNACEAMEAQPVGERRLAIQVAPDEGGYGRLSVSDTGPGITSLPPERVFEPFVSSKPDGLGMGLAICRKVVTAHGGEIWAANNDLVGATFHVRLPASADRAAAAGTVDVQRHASSLAGSGSRGDQRLTATI